MANSVWKLDVDGNLVWPYDTGDSTCGIDVDSDGNVYVGGIRSGNNSIWKLDDAGNLLWDYDTGDTVLAVCVDSEGNVYAGGIRTGGNSVWKLDTDGGLIWSYDTGDQVNGIALDRHGNVYVTGSSSGGKWIWKLDNDGNFVWSYADVAGGNSGHGIRITNYVYVVAQGIGYDYIRLTFNGVFSCYGKFTPVSGPVHTAALGIDVIPLRVKLAEKSRQVQYIDDSGIKKTQVIAGRVFTTGAWYGFNPGVQQFKVSDCLWICFCTFPDYLSADLWAIRWNPAKTFYVVGGIVTAGQPNITKIIGLCVSSGSCDVQWQYTTGGTYIRSIAIDADDNIYAAGARA